MYQGRQSFLSNIPPAVRILLIINVAMLLLTWLLETMNIVNLTNALGLYFFESDLFRPFQIITHMFMHGGFIHLLFNMYALWMFGQIIEQVWGPKRFLLYYFITGLGAALLHTAVNYFQLHSIEATLTPEQIQFVKENGAREALRGFNFANEPLSSYNGILNFPTVGASGAIYGILLAFGMLFPNAPLQIMFIPIPIKAKYFVIAFGLIELTLGINNAQGDNIAHFAHLGGMIFGFIMIKIWGKGTPKNDNFYREY
jgi:membrane associated rhomboid family serine protease